MKRQLIYAACFAAVALVASRQADAQVFLETWDDGLGSSRWSTPIMTQEDTSIAFDGSVDYAYDYSVIAAPSAPNSVGGTTIGVAMETNTTDQTDSGEGEAVGIIPLGLLGDIPAGDFVLTTDAYFFVNGVTASTEYGTIGVYSGGTASPARYGISAGDGLAWQLDGEGGTTTDIVRFENPGTGENSLGGYEDIADGSIPGVGTGAAGTLGPQNQWVELKIESAAGIVAFSMNGFVIDTFDNTGGALSGGKLLLGQSDAFNSVNPDDANGNSQVVVFDNIQLAVPVPEPASFALLGMGALLLLGRRRQD